MKDDDGMSWDEEDFMTTEEYNQMVDDAFEKAERWSDF